MIIEDVSNELNQLYNENNIIIEKFNTKFQEYKFLSDRLNNKIFQDISSERQKENGTLKILFKYIQRVGENKGKEKDIIFTFYPLSGNIIRDDKIYIFEGTPGINNKTEGIKKFIYYFYFKFMIQPDVFEEFKKQIKTLK